MRLLFFTLIFMQILNTAMAASIYKWIDEDGQVHYESKAKNKNAKEMKIKDVYIDTGSSSTKALSAEERANKLKRFVNSIEAENKSKAEEKRQKREQEEKRVVRCNASRDQLKRAESASALYDLDEKGNRILLNKKQYQQAMQQARARVQKWCH